MIFIITMLALNIFITQGAEIGWTSSITIVLLVVTINWCDCLYKS